MPLPFHPEKGTIVICDFAGLKEPEMVKRRPAVILTPCFKGRENLCSVVPMSTTQPKKVRPYHYELILENPLPAPYNSRSHWIKGDMIYTVSISRLQLPFNGKDDQGKRLYDLRVISGEVFDLIKESVRNGLAL